MGGGGLLGTVRRLPVILIGTQMYTGVQAGGGLFWWAKVHEYGGEKTYPILPVNKKALALLSAGVGRGRLRGSPNRSN